MANFVELNAQNWSRANKSLPTDNCLDIIEYWAQNFIGYVACRSWVQWKYEFCLIQSDP